ncbi:MAG: hypothetical protein IJZ29_04385 [Clostridia bacterium]|nr:hypothetical protein [Clostridia bacterium]
MSDGKGRGGCSRFLFFFLGIIVGVVLVFGAIFGAGYWVYSSANLKTVEQTFGIDLSDVPDDLKSITIQKLIPMVNEVGQMPLDEFCEKYDISLPTKIDVGYDDLGNKLQIDITEPLQPMLNAKVVDAFGKINEVIDYFTISKTFELLAQANDLPDFNFLHDDDYKDRPIMEIASMLDEFTIADLMETSADLNSGLLKYIKDMRLVDLATENGLDDAINNMEIGEILGIDSTAGGVMGAISTLKVGELNDNNLITAIGELTLEEVLKIESTATGIIGEVKDLTINQIKNGEIEDAIKTLTLGEVMEITETSGIMYELKDVQIQNLTSAYIMENITVGTALGSDATTGIMGAINGWKLSQLTESNIKTIKVGTALDIDENATGILGAIKELSIGDLNSEESVQNAIKGLKISDIITITGESTIFDKIKDIELQNLNDANIINAISTLKVKEIIENTGSGSDNKIWNIIAESEIGAISSTINNLKVSDVVDFNYDSDNDGYNDSYTGFLSFLIDTENGKDPKLTELNSAIEGAIDDYVDDYFSTNTIGDLVDAGILNVDTTSAKYPLIKDMIAKDFIEEAVNNALA